MNEASPAGPHPPQVVVMGVSGSGKSTVGELLARRLGVEYADADDFHNPANVAKMAAGTPLTDVDRWPWLDAIGHWLASHERTGAVVTCSALKRRYRDALRERAPQLYLLYLHGSPEVITARVSNRPHHFMPASLVKSQFDALEPPEPDERAVFVDVSASPHDITSSFLNSLPAAATGSEGLPKSGEVH